MINGLKKVVTKMSKSLKNVINPDEVIEEYGVDSLRLYEMFLGPLTQSKPWDIAGIHGVKRFLTKVWKMQEIQMQEKLENKNVLRSYNKMVKSVKEDTKNCRFNTAISSMMIFVNCIYKENILSKEIFKNFILILAPYAPHICEELWNILGEKDTLSYASYPSYDPKFIIEDDFELVVQINGKVKDKIMSKKGIHEDVAKKLALESSKIKNILNNRDIKKVIFVKDKLINIVL